MFRILSILIISGLYHLSVLGAEPKPEEITAAIRDRLSPIVESTLQTHCGEECPSFKIDTQFSKPAQSLLDGLGFTKPAESTEVPNKLSSITVSILIQEKVPQSSKEALKQILSHRVSNESPVPVHIQLKTLSALSPILEKNSHPNQPATLHDPSSNERLVLIKMVIWPVCLLLFALTGFIALLFFFKNRRDLLRDRITAFHETQNQSDSVEGDHLIKTPPTATSFLETRPEDLFWLIEDLASQEDFTSLKKIVSIYQPQELTSKFKFSNQALRVLSSLSEEIEKAVRSGATAAVGSKAFNSNETLSWLKESLDQVHWKRIAEQNLPLNKLARLTDEQCTKLFHRLSSTDDQATFLEALPQERWPNLLSQLNSEKRVQIGLCLSKQRSSDGQERQRLESVLSAELERLFQTPSWSHRGVLENFTLYLSESEGQKLWQALSEETLAKGLRVDPYSHSSAFKPFRSIDSLIQELRSEVLAELFTSLDIPSLFLLTQNLSAEAKQRVWANLPKSLRDRLQTQADLRTTQPMEQAGQNDAQLMRARARFLDSYRRLNAGEKSTQGLGL